MLHSLATAMSDPSPAIDCEPLYARIAELEKEVADCKVASEAHSGTELALKDSLAYAESILDTVREPMLVLDAALHVKTASRAFYQTFAVLPEDTIGRFVYDLGNGQWNIPALRALLEEVLPKENTFWDYEVEHEFPTLGAG